MKASGAAGGLKDAVARPPAEAVRLPSDEAVAVKEARAAGTGAHGMEPSVYLTPEARVLPPEVRVAVGTSVARLKSRTFEPGGSRTASAFALRFFRTAQRRMRTGLWRDEAGGDHLDVVPRLRGPATALARRRALGRAARQSHHQRAGREEFRGSEQGLAAGLDSDLTTADGEFRDPARELGELVVGPGVRPEAAAPGSS